MKLILLLCVLFSTNIFAQGFTNIPVSGIDTTITSVQNGDFLTYSSTSSTWYNTQLSLSNIPSFDVSSPSSSEVLTYNGTKWINDTLVNTLGFTPIGGSGTVNRLSYFDSPSTESSASSLVWNNSTQHLGIGIAPTYALDVNTQTRLTGSGGAVGAIGGASYGLSVQNNAATSWIEILNNGGAGKGAFFGMTGNSMEIHNYQGGEITLNTGATPSTSIRRLTVASDGKIGIGNINPIAAIMHVDDGASTFIKFTQDGSTGITQFDGTDIGLDATNNTIIKQREDLDIIAYTNNIERLRIKNTGKVGISTDNPSTELSVSGNITANSATIPNLNSINLAYLKTSPTVGAYQEGKIYYDETWKTLSINEGRDVTLQVGQEELTRVYNNTGSTISNGKAVYSTGAYTAGSNDVLTVDLAIATNSASAFVLGVATQDIGPSEYGLITVRGMINELDTTSLGTPGNPLYLSDTVAGNLTYIAPSLPSYKVLVGRLITSNVSGRINIRIDNALKLGDLLDVSVPTPSIDDTIVWNGLGYVNKAFTAITGGNAIAYYLEDNTIDIPTYGDLSTVPSATGEYTDTSGTINSSSIFMESYASASTGLDGSGIIEAGTWTFNFWASVTVTNNTNFLDYWIYKRTALGVETFLFKCTSANIASTSIVDVRAVCVQPSYAINSTDRLVLKVYARTTGGSNRTITFTHSGSARFSNIVTPMLVRHNSLSGLQGGGSNNYYHSNQGINTTDTVNFLGVTATSASVGALYNSGTFNGYTWPSSDGSNDYCLKTNGSKTLSFEECGGGTGDSASLNITLFSATTEVTYQSASAATSIDVNLAAADAVIATSRYIKNKGTENMRVVPLGGKTIESATYFELSPGQAILTVYDGIEWSIFADATLPTPAEFYVDYLVLGGGGGGGGSYYAGGGGGGQLIESNMLVTGKTSYTVTVGEGGNGGASTIANGVAGGNSVFDTITAIGGGYGGGYNLGAGGNGASGGGGAANAGAGGSSTSTPTGYAGGTGAGTGGGGGGGCSSAGANGSGSNAAGGNGCVSSITGDTYAAGGKGRANGGASTVDAGANTGNGGDGSDSGSYNGAKGGSGKVVIRYFGAPKATGGTITADGSYTVHTFNSSGTFRPN